MFSDRIIEWYHTNHRKLPWRETKDPYLIWISEIILQQTRVDQGLNYYNKITSIHPNVFSLAHSTEESLLRLWQGLGYYSRARNMHFTAKYITDELDGNFPTSYKEIIKLKGIGDYTASAIASFAYNEVCPVVDGNVERVLTRYFAIEDDISKPSTKKTLKSIAGDLIDKSNPAIFNQSIMEIGALVCTPKSPKCNECPVNDSCEGLMQNKVAQIPFKSKKVKVKNRHFHYLVDFNKSNIALQIREGADIWQNLYEFPMLESKNEYLPIENELKKNWKLHSQKKHILSHQRIFAYFYLSDDNSVKENFSKAKYYSLDQIEELPKPILIKKFLDELEF